MKNLIIYNLVKIFTVHGKASRFAVQRSSLSVMRKVQVTNNTDQ